MILRLIKSSSDSPRKESCTAVRKYQMKGSALVVINVALIIVLIALTVLARLYLSSFKILMTVLICLFWGVGILFGFILLPAFFHRTVIYVSGTEITVHTGLLFLRREHMRMSAVQYVTKITFPFSGITGFNFVLVRGLGGTVMLPFLRTNDSLDITNLLQLKITER